MRGHRSIPEFRPARGAAVAARGGSDDLPDLDRSGATRLTVSGLSIVEWKPVTGVLPPLSEPAWQAEFDGYKAIPNTASSTKA